MLSVLVLVKDSALLGSSSSRRTLAGPLGPVATKSFMNGNVMIIILMLANKSLE